MRKGFTLVELSIVLVIIGLLIGGILVAQSMISTARVQSYVRNLQQYDIAITNFKTNYKQFPGDSSLFIPPGNNDDKINGNGGCNGAYIIGEYTYVWTHLSQSGMIKGDYVPYEPSFCSGGPHSNYSLTAGVVGPIFAKDQAYKKLYKTENVPVIYASDGAADSYRAAIGMLDSKALDSKIDDGMSNSGKYQGVDDTQETPVNCDDYINGVVPDNGMPCSFTYYPPQ